MSKNTNINTKQSVGTVIKNCFFLINLMFKASPSYIMCVLLDSIRKEVSIFFEHTILIGYVLEAAEFGYPFKTVAKTIIIYALLITVGMIFTVYAFNYVVEKERPKVKQKIKMLLYNKAKSVDLACYDNPDYYNNQVLALSEVDNQVERVTQFIKDTVEGLTALILTSGYFIVKDALSIVFVVASFALSYVFHQMYNKLNFKEKIEKNPPVRKRDYTKRIFYLSEYAKEIRLNPEASDILFDRFTKANEEVYEVERKYSYKKFGLSFLKGYVANDLFCNVFYVIYLIYKAAIKRVISFSNVAILFHSFDNLKQGLRVFTESYPFACETSLYVQRIRDFLNEKSKIISGEIKPSSTSKSLDLKDVTFTYSEKMTPVLKDISLSIKPGEKIALVGYNGAGKTTLVKLLMRLYDTTSGEIYADNQNIKDFDLNAYRDSIGTVFQDFKIFAGTISENVTLDVSSSHEDEKITQALSESGLIKKVNSLPQGLNTQLTHEFDDKGVNLSGGESQKLAISRVFYKDVSLMILDEPSSALDPIAEYQLNHAMLEATKNKTVIFISHRLSTTRLADHIFMLEDGQIVEKGTHDELLKSNGKYASMWKAQAGAYIDV